MRPPRLPNGVARAAVMGPDRIGMYMRPVPIVGRTDESERSQQARHFTSPTIPPSLTNLSNAELRAVGNSGLTGRPASVACTPSAGRPPESAAAMGPRVAARCQVEGRAVNADEVKRCQVLTSCPKPPRPGGWRVYYAGNIRSQRRSGRCGTRSSTCHQSHLGSTSSRGAAVIQPLPRFRATASWPRTGFESSSSALNPSGCPTTSTIRRRGA
jgi:hypothetical protein